MATQDTSGGFDLGSALIAIGSGLLSRPKTAPKTYRQGFISDDAFKKNCYTLKVDEQGYVIDLDKYRQCEFVWNDVYTSRERKDIERVMRREWPPTEWKVKRLEEFENFGVGNEETFGARPTRSIAAGVVGSFARQAVASAGKILRDVAAKGRRAKLRRLPGSGTAPVRVLRGVARTVPGAGVAVIVGEQLLRGYEKLRIGQIKRGGAVLTKSAQERLKSFGGVRGVNKAINAQKRELKQFETFALKELRRAQPVDVPASSPFGVPAGRVGRRTTVGSPPAPKVKGTVSEIVVPRRLQQRRRSFAVRSQPNTRDVFADKVGAPVQKAVDFTRQILQQRNARKSSSQSSFRRGFAEPLRSPAPALSPLTALKAQSVASRCAPCRKGSQRPRREKPRSKVRKRKVCFER